MNKRRKITLRIRLLHHLTGKIKDTKVNINNTGNEAKSFWVGYNQALTDIKDNFLKPNTLNQ